MRSWNATPAAGPASEPIGPAPHRRIAPPLLPTGPPDHRSETGGRGVCEQRRSTRRWTSAESSGSGRPAGGFVTREGALYAFLLGSAAGHVIISGLHLPPRTSVRSLSAGTGSDGGRHHRAPCSNFPPASALGFLHRVLTFRSLYCPDPARAGLRRGARRWPQQPGGAHSPARSARTTGSCPLGFGSGSDSRSRRPARAS